MVELTTSLALRPWWDLFGGIPIPFQALFWLVLAVTLSSAISLITLLISAARFRRALSRQAKTKHSTADDFLWVFLVPALNEEITITDTVARLRQVQAQHKVVLVIDDGSEDATGTILRSLAGDDLEVLTRVPPEARAGKAASLNAAYRHLLSEVLPQRFPAWRHERVLVCVVDADGRLAPDAPAHVAPHFTEASMGGAQCLVRIYNRTGLLTWAQDVEFSAFGLVFQAGRAGWGTANMGGNGQFNRLCALQTIADPVGPWRDRLTEDQDLGVRLIQAGWHGTQVNTATIDQQGLPSLRRLYRQRTRWAQGSWQALALLPGTLRTRLSPIARLDAVYYLLTPLLQLFTGVGLVSAIIVAAVYDVSFWPGSPVIVVFFVSLGFGPGFTTLILREPGWRSLVSAIVVVIPYTVYSWVVFPVLTVGLLRQLSGRTAWAKTEREPLDARVGATTRA